MRKKVTKDLLIEKRLKGLTNSLVLIKYIVYYLGPISAGEIADIVAKLIRTFEPTQEGINTYILPVLRNHDYYKETNGKWEIVNENFPEHKEVPKILAREHRILTERELRNKLAEALSLRTKEVCVELERIADLKRFDGGWGLKSWEVVNDLAFEVLKSHGSPLQHKEILQLISEKFKKDLEKIVIYLEADKRFIFERKAWKLAEEIEGVEAKRTRKKALLKQEAVHLELEESFLKAQGIEKEVRAEPSAPPKVKVKLRKSAKQQEVREILKERELHVVPVEVDLATELSATQPSTSVMEATSFNRVERSQKERSLSQKERQEMVFFIDRLLQLEEKGVSQDGERLRKEPLSIQKLLHALRLRFPPYFTERVVIPHDFYSFVADLITPLPGKAVLNPSAHDGLFAVEVLTSLFNRLEDAVWAPRGNQIEVVQKDGLRYSFSIEGTSLEKKCREDFLVTQNDVIDYFIENNFASIEHERVLAQSAKYNLRLAGFPNVYLANRDFLSQLPEVFGEPPNENNEISLRFDLVFGNFTFLKSHNLSANYIDQTLKILDEDGVAAFFVLKELLQLLKDHTFMNEIRAKFDFRYIFSFPQVDGAEIMLVILKKREREEAAPLIAGRVKDVKDLRPILVDLARGIKQSIYYEYLKQESVRRVIAE